MAEHKTPLLATVFVFQHSVESFVKVSHLAVLL